MAEESSRLQNIESQRVKELEETSPHTNIENLALQSCVGEGGKGSCLAHLSLLPNPK